MARLFATVDVRVQAVIEEESRAGGRYYTVVGMIGGERMVLYCPADALPGDPDKIRGQVLSLPVAIQGNRLDVAIRRAS